MTPLEKGQLLTDEDYLDAVEEHGDDFVAKMGAEAIYDLLKAIDLKEQVEILREEINSTNSETKSKSTRNVLKSWKRYWDQKISPEWMILTVLAGIAA